MVLNSRKKFQPFRKTKTRPTSEFASKKSMIYTTNRENYMKDTSRDYDIPLSQRQKPCNCGDRMWFNTYCGAWVCDNCGKHDGLARCFCGWAESGGDGHAELVEMGETIGDEYPDGGGFFDNG